MSLLNQTQVSTLVVDDLYLQGKWFNTGGRLFSNANIVYFPNQTTPLTTEIIINDQTKNQALYQGLLSVQDEIYGNIHGNTFPQLQAEIDAIEANVLLLQQQDVNLQNQINATNSNVFILQGNVVSLQSQINVLSGNVVIDEQAIAELIRDTQFLEAPYAGLVGNTSYFVNGLQMWSGADENGNGMFVYKDGGTAGLSQIRMRVEDDKNILVEGGSQLLKPKSTGNVSIKNTDGNFQFLVGDRTTANFQNISTTAINGNIVLRGQDNTAISIYTEPAQTIPLPIPAIKRCDVRGDDETRIFGGAISATGDSGGSLQIAKSVRVFTPGGATPGQIDLQVGTCDLNTTGKINIGTEQGLTEAGFKEIYIGQNGPPSAARKSSTLLDGDTYLPQNLVLSPNPGAWDNITYIGLPTAYSGPLRGPLKSTYTPYVKSISTFFQGPTINSFVSLAGTFSVLVGLGAITMAAGAGGVAITSGIGAIGLTTAGGAIGLTTGGGACQITTGAGAINMTTGAGPIQMETNNGDILLHSGGAPGGVAGSTYITPKDYLILNPDEQIIIGQDGNLPVYGALIDTSSYQFNGNLFLSDLTGNVVQSNIFQTQASATYLTGASFGYISWINPNLIGNTYGNATMNIVNFDNSTVVASSSLSPINPNTFGSFSFGSSEILLPSNANLIAKIYPQGNVVNYQYKTWQSNALIPSNVGVVINAVVRPNNINTTHFVNVYGNVFFNDELDTFSNIVLKNQVNQDTTIITDDSIFTTGDITAQNFYGNSHQVSGNITGDYFIGNNMILSQTGQAQFFKATNSVILDPQGAPITNPANALSNSGGQLYFNGNVVGGANTGVTQIIAGNGITISPIPGVGNVTVSLAGSVIPPGGYLPIAGGSMTGSIYQSPSSNINDNTIKKYRPLTSYQPPFPSIGTPSFTGEQLTFFNGDNSPEQVNFTGWFPENMFAYQPDIITRAITGVSSNFYSSSGGTSGGAFYWRTAINNFTVGQRIAGGQITVNSSIQASGVRFYIFTAAVNDPDPLNWTLLYQQDLNNFPTGAATYSLSDIDFTFMDYMTNLGQNWMEIKAIGDPITVNIDLNTIGTSVGGFTSYAWDGFIQNAVSSTEYFIGAQADPTQSVLYEYFPATNTTNKLVTVSLTNGQLAKIYGVYDADVDVSRNIIVYGNFNTAVEVMPDGQIVTFVVNHIFMYNIDNGFITQLTTNSLDPAYVGNLPKGVNGPVYGVEKQSSLVLSRKVWMWGDFTGVAQMGNPSQPTDCTLTCGINFTQSDNWGVSIQWGTTNANNSLNTCRGGRIANDDPNNTSTFALMVWATTRNAVNFRTISIAYFTNFSLGLFSTTLYPFGNGNFGNVSLTTNVVSRIDPVFITDPSPGINALVFCGSYIGVAHGGGMVDVPCYSLSSTDTTNNNFNPANNPPWGNDLKILADSGDASFWNPNNVLIGSTTYKKMTNETAVIGTTGYFSGTTMGGGVMTFDNAQFYVSAPTVNKFFITNVPAYSVKNVIGTNALAVNLSCSLNEDNFWYGQTFNANISPPSPPTIPTVNAINGAKFLVNNVEMDKIVFSGGDTDFSSVSFIAGSVEKGDPHWYWQSQVGALDYFAGNVFYPNITASGSAGNSGVYTAGQNITINGNVISLSDPLTSNLDLASVAITGNGFNNEINMTLDFTGLNVINTVSNDSLTIDELSLTFLDITNNRVSQYDAFVGIGFEDLGGNMVSNLRREDLTINDIVLTNLTNLTSTQIQTQNTGNLYSARLDISSGNPQFFLQNATNQFSITKSGADTNISQTGNGDINISTNNIVAITSQNAVEIGTPQRRQELVAVEVLNTGTQSSQNLFDSVSGIINTSSWTNTTLNTTITDVTVAGLYDDGMNGNQTMVVALMEDDGGVETVLASLNANLSSTLGTFTLTFSTVLNPSPTKFYFIRLSVPPQSPMYAYYGTITDGLTPFCTVLGLQLQTVSDPVDYFNVYGNSFFQDNMLIHSNLTVADPSNNFFKSIIDYNQIQLLGENFNTQMGPGQTYITFGTNQQVQTSTLLQLRQTGGYTQQSALSQTNLGFVQSTSRSANYGLSQLDINSLSGPIARGTFRAGEMELNHNDNGSFINLRRDSITPASTFISRISSFARNSVNTQFEYSRIQTQTENNSSGNEDGTLQIYNLVNGTLQQTFTFNGAQNENNSFRPLDMNSNDIRTTTGNLVLTANASTGVGNATLQSKSGANVIINTGATGTINFITSTTTAVQNHTSSLATTSNIPDITQYLQCSLNGVPIWIPYFTQNPGI